MMHALCSVSECVPAGAVSDTAAHPSCAGQVSYMSVYHYIM